MNMNTFKHLFSPLQIKGITVRNRFTVSAMVTNYANKDGTMTERFRAYYEEKAKGGWGLIIIENFPVNSTAGKFSNLPTLFSPTHIEQYRHLTRLLHSYGAVVFAQIYHAGNKASRSITGVRPVAPSAVFNTGKRELPHELTIDEIYSIEEDFAVCARAAKEAGFDGIEVHGGHGYLLNQFSSAVTNKRTDKYGSSLQNRMRFPVETIRAVRKAVGEEFLIGYRISSVEYCCGGTQIEESAAMAKMLEKAGVDILNVSQGSDQSYVVIPPACIPPAAYANHAAQIRRAVHIPVMAVGRINDPYVAEELLASGKCDMVVMARSSIADPHLPEKVATDRLNDIQYCIGCLQGCTGQNRIGGSVRCLVNPMTGREAEYDLAPSSTPKKVYIAGGGVSGCEAAIAAAIKGHKVTLFEASDRLGGQWIAASIPPGKSGFASFLCWQS